MKKKILMLVCAFCFVIPAVLFGLTACGTKDTEKPKEPTKPETPPVTISLEYELINDGTEYSVVGLGNYNKTSLTIPATYENKPVTAIGPSAFKDGSLINVTIPEGVTTIYGEAFKGCSQLDNITIPQSLTYIGDDAFLNCKVTDVKYLGNINDWVSINFAASDANPIAHTWSNGSNLIINDEVVTRANITTASEIKAHSFSNYDKLTEVILGLSVEKIGERAFSGCEGIEEITISASLTKVEGFAFGACESLQEVNFNGDINDWLELDFESTSSNPLKNGADLKFYGQLVTTANITATEVKPYAFEGYKSLTDVVLGENVESIGDYAFMGCLALETIDMSENVTTIGEWAFQGCSALTSMTIYENVTTIGENAFNNCSSLEEVKYTGDINDWVSIDFGNELANPLNDGAKLKINDEIVTTANITATKIKPYAFYNYNQLTSLILDESVASIGERAFEFCSSLNGKEVEYTGDINDWVSINFGGVAANPLSRGAKLKINSEIVTTINITTTEIKSHAFEGYDYLIEVVLSENVESIGEYAFRSCSEITTVIIDSETVANALVKNSSLGNLVANAQTIYVKAGLSVSNSTYLLENFTKQLTSDKDGYDMYVKNA